MKILHRLLVLYAITVGFLTLETVSAQTIEEDFPTDGVLSGSTPDAGIGDWTSISGSPALAVSSGILTIAAGGGESSQLNFNASNLSSGTIYMGFNLEIDSSGSISTSDSIQSIAGFRVGTAGSGTNALSFGVFRPSGAAQSFSSIPTTSTSQVVAGIFTGSSLNATSNNLSGWATSIDRGTASRIVIGFDLTNDSGTLWVNPTSSGSTSITLSGITSDARGVFFRQGAASHGQGFVDNLNVSVDFNIAAALAAVPEPSTYAAILGAMALIGALFFRRRNLVA